MEDNKRGGYGRRTEGRRDYGRSDSNRNYGEKRSYGDKPSYGEKRTYGSKPSFGGHSNRRNFGDKPVNYGEKRSFGERNSFGDKRSFGDKPSYERNSERPSYGEKRTYGNKPSFGGNSNRRSFGEKTSNYGEKRSFGEKRSLDERSSFGEKRSFGDRKRTFSDRKPSGRPGAKGFGGKRNAYGDLNYFRNEDESGISRMINRRPQIDSGAYSDNDMIMTPVKEEVRLNKFIANSGICSRREADNFILAGVVTVNGEVITELGTKININTDDVRFNGERLKGESKVYIVMNKPKGYVTTSSDPHADKTVMDLLKKCPSRVFPVGRLDKNTTGVLMFTNDGEIAEKLTHPSYDKKKIYQVSLDSKLKQEDFDKIMSGVELSDGVIAADALEYIEDDDHRKLGIEIHSGKNRIVRRIFESLGYEVKALDRVYFAGLTKKGIKRGDWRYLTEGETNLLKMGAYL